MELPGRGCLESLLKIKTVSAENLRGAVPVFGKESIRDAGTFETAIWIETAFRERYGTLLDFLTCLGWGGGGVVVGEVTLLDESVFFWTPNDFQYGLGKALRCKCMGGREKCIFLGK